MEATKAASAAGFVSKCGGCMTMEQIAADLRNENARLREMLQGMVWDAEATYDAVKKSTHGAEISIGQFRRLNAARAALAGGR